MLYDENFRYTEKSQMAYDMIKSSMESLFDTCIKSYNLTPEEIVTLVVSEITWRQSLYRTEQIIAKQKKEKVKLNEKRRLL